MKYSDYKVFDLGWSTILLLYGAYRLYLFYYMNAYVKLIIFLCDIDDIVVVLLKKIHNNQSLSTHASPHMLISI